MERTWWLYAYAQNEISRDIHQALRDPRDRGVTHNYESLRGGRVYRIVTMCTVVRMGEGNVRARHDYKGASRNFCAYTEEKTTPYMWQNKDQARKLGDEKRCLRYRDRKHWVALQHSVEVTENNII